MSDAKLSRFTDKPAEWWDQAYCFGSGEGMNCSPQGPTWMEEFIKYLDNIKPRVDRRKNPDHEINDAAAEGRLAQLQGA